MFLGTHSFFLLLVFPSSLILLLITASLLQPTPQISHNPLHHANPTSQPIRHLHQLRLASLVNQPITRLQRIRHNPQTPQKEPSRRIKLPLFELEATGTVFEGFAVRFDEFGEEAGELVLSHGDGVLWAVDEDVLFCGVAV